MPYRIAEAQDCRERHRPDWAWALALAPALSNLNRQQLKAYRLRSPRDPCAVLGEHITLVVLVGDLADGQWLTEDVAREQRCSDRDIVLGLWGHWGQELRYGTSRRADFGERHRGNCMALRNTNAEVLDNNDTRTEH